MIDFIMCWYHRIMFRIESWRLRRELDKLNDGLWDAGEEWEDTE